MKDSDLLAIVTLIFFTSGLAASVPDAGTPLLLAASIFAVVCLIAGKCELRNKREQNKKKEDKS